MRLGNENRVETIIDDCLAILRLTDAVTSSFRAHRTRRCLCMVGIQIPTSRSNVNVRVSHADSSGGTGNCRELSDSWRGLSHVQQVDSARRKGRRRGVKSPTRASMIVFVDCFPFVPRYAIVRSAPIQISDKIIQRAT